MPDAKISALPQATALTDDDQYAAVSSTSSKKVVGAQLRAYMQAVKQLAISGATQFIASGATTLSLYDSFDTITTGAPLASGTVSIQSDNYVLQYARTQLFGNARATMTGTARINLFDFAPNGRLVLAGRGF